MSLRVDMLRAVPPPPPPRPAVVAPQPTSPIDIDDIEIEDTQVRRVGPSGVTNLVFDEDSAELLGQDEDLQTLRMVARHLLAGPAPMVATL